MATSTIPMYHLGDTGEKTLATKFGGTVKYRKRNGIVCVYMDNTNLTGMTANADNPMGTTLPSGFRPVSGISVMSRLYSDNGYVFVDGNGRVVIHPTVAAQYVAFCVTYIAI